jgi:CelD/BcsL family acetyltransferase involved in cellulose biosynthesis
MRVQVIPIKELSENLKKGWLSIQASNQDLTGPCFHPELFVAVGKFNPQVYVTVLCDGKKSLGFLPFQKDQRLSIAKPIDFCDYDAIIGSKDDRWDIDKILKQSGLKGWEFKALTDFNKISTNNIHLEKKDSPRVDLTYGYEKYLDYQKQKKISYSNLMYKMRLLERNIGPIHFVPICNDVAVLHLMLSWKKQRYNCPSDWIDLATNLLEYLYYFKNSSLSGVLSVLYAGDDIIAAVFNLRYQGILHYLMPSFNPIFSKYSPGSLMAYYLISELHAFQCNILDFAPGAYRQYKWDFANSSLPIIRGTFKVHSFKEEIKSVKWLYQSIRPVVRIARKAVKLVST